MNEQLHAPNAVLPGKWAISHCKQGWVGLRAGPDRYEKEKISCPPPGFKSDCPACRYTIYTIPLPATQRVLVCLWHKVGEKIIKITLHKDLYDTNSKICVLVSYDSCIYLLCKLHKAL